VAALVAAGGILAYLSSPEFKEKARLLVVGEIESRTGGHASVGRLHWNLWTRRVTLFDVTIRGVEPADGPPLAHIESIEAGLSFRSLLNRKLDLFELTVTRPEFHLFVDATGGTNLPSPPPRDESGLAEYQVSIRNFRVASGLAFVNERQFGVDFTLRNLESDLTYQSVNRILSAHTTYDGVLNRTDLAAIPYRLSADVDYTRGTILAKHIVIGSGKSQIQLQGRINDVFTRDISGKLDYSGVAAVPFMNYFLPKDSFSGSASLAGALEFGKGSFYTHGLAQSDAITYNEWKATAFRGDYAYRFPEKKLTVEHLTARAFDGSADGDITVDALPGPSRVNLDIHYKDVDGTLLAGYAPWDRKYRIESRITGQVQGWFEGRFERYEFAGGASLAANVRKPETGIVSLPLDGSLGYAIRPGRATLANANLRFLATSILADGQFEPQQASARVRMMSSDLSNLRFVYPDANGTGSFDGLLTGTLKNPVADGTFDLYRHKYKEWTIEHASGMARLDTQANTAVLTNVNVVQGQSTITVNGTTTLDGTKLDLRVQSARVYAEDTAPFINQKLSGLFSGAIHLTSLKPIRFDGDVRATGLVLQGQTISDVQSHVQYDDPSVMLQNLAIADNGSTLTGRATYNMTTEAMTIAVRINSVDFKRLRPLGMPEALEGIVRQADLTGSGTRTKPLVDGNAQLQNLSFHGETFPQARVDVSTEGTKLNVKLSETRNLDLTAQIDTAAPGYPFTADAIFKRYSIEKLAGFNRGTLIATGDAALKGSLNDLGHITGSGHINPAEMVIQGQKLESAKPFAFQFNSDLLTLTDVSLESIKGTQMNLSGTIGLTPAARLNLTLSGQIDAGIVASDEAWTIGGTVDIFGQIRGTVSNPDLQGRASFTDLSVARQGVSLNLTGLKGDVLFDERRMTMTNVEGRTNGGTVSLQGTGTITGKTIGALNIRVEAKGVRLRYPNGPRAMVDGTLAVAGTLESPTVSGNLEIQSLTLNSSFDEILALFDTSVPSDTASPFGNVRLSLNVTGNRNITIHNELASAGARVDLGIKGTVDRPALTGRVETSDGTLLFNGRKYDITRGNIDFVDPVRIDPVINIQAETSVRNYQVFLSITGRMNRLALDMRSIPPLPQLDIVNLISGGKTTDELAQTVKAGELPTNERVFQGGAATIMSDLLVSRLGSKVNLLGLDRVVHIDPFVVGASNVTSQRITYSQQFTKELSVTYSQDLGSNKQQIIQIEYFITKNVSVLASKDENDVRALDLRIRKRF